MYVVVKFRCVLQGDWVLNTQPRRCQFRTYNQQVWLEWGASRIAYGDNQYPAEGGFFLISFSMNRRKRIFYINMGLEIARWRRSCL